jgi:hypothetical protein
MTPGREWITEWPQFGNSTDRDFFARPLAVEVTIVLTDYGEIRRLCRGVRMRQRGVALITAIVLVAIATVLAGAHRHRGGAGSAPHDRGSPRSTRAGRSRSAPRPGPPRC